MWNKNQIQSVKCQCMQQVLSSMQHEIFLFKINNTIFYLLIKWHFLIAY